MFPLTPDPNLNKDLAEAHQRRLLEEAEADAVARGEAEAGDYQPVTDDQDDFIDEPNERNRLIKTDK